ncbi:MAG: histidine kinase [Paenibacillaceae bacterium]|nr:histidine kinase [Paenibacillaceae bacterium]
MNRARRTVKFTRFLMLFSLTAVLLLLCIVGAVLYGKTKSFIDGKKDDIVTMQIGQAVTDVKRQFEDVRQAIDGLRNNESFLDTVKQLSGKQTDSYREVVLSQTLESSLFNIKIDNDFIDSVVVLAGAEQYSSRQSYLEGMEAYASQLFREAEPIRFVPPGQTYRMLGIERAWLAESPQRLSLDRMNETAYIASRLEADGLAGVILVFLDPANLRKLIPYAESLAVLTEGSDVMYRGSGVPSGLLADIKPQTAEGDAVLHAQGRRYHVREIGFFGVRIVFAEAGSGFHERQLALIGLYAAAILLGCALLSLLLTRLLGGSMLLPLHRLIRWIGRYDQLDDRMQPEGGAAGRDSRMTMRDRLFVYFILTIMLPIVLFVVLFYVQSSRVVSRELKETYAAAFDKVVHRIELFVGQRETMLARFAFDSWTADFVQQADEKKRQELDQLVLTQKPSMLTQDMLSVYDADNRLVYANRSKLNTRLPQDYIDEMRLTRKNIYYHPQQGNGSPSVSLGMAIVPLSRFSDPTGYLTLDVEEVYFSSLYGELKANGNTAFIVDDKGRILSHADPEAFGRTETLPAPLDSLNGYFDRKASALYFAATIGSLPWHLVSIYDYSAIRKQSQELIYNDVYLLIIVFLLVLLLSYAMAQYLIRPLASMQFRHMDIQLGDFQRFFSKDTYRIDEVDQLQHSFNRMLERIEQLVGVTVAADRRQMMLQIEALQAQINPHFLHNTLENIVYLIEDDERDSAVTMIGLLGRLFRYAMGKDRPLTTLGEELAYAQSYVKLMNLRFKNRIDFTVEADEAWQACATVKMIVQPIVENAIQHGMPHGKGSVRIAAVCRREGDSLLLSVADNGPGIAPERLAVLRERLRDGGRDNVGLYNVHSRLRLQFGEACGLAIDSTPGAGTVVTLRLPLLLPEDDREQHV